MNATDQAEVSRETEVAPEWHHEVWTYVGMYRTSKGKPGQQWRDTADGRWHFSGTTGLLLVGGTYEMRVSRDDQGSPTLHGGPAQRRYLGRDKTIDRAELLSWEAMDNAVRASFAAERSARTDAKRTEFDNAMEPLVAAARKLRTQADRDAFTAAVLRRMMERAWG